MSMFQTNKTMHTLCKYALRMTSVVQWSLYTNSTGIRRQRAKGLAEAVYGPSGRIDRGVPATIRLCARTLQLYAFADDAEDEWREQV